MRIIDYATGKNKINRKTANKYNAIIKSNQILQVIVRKIRYGED